MKSRWWGGRGGDISDWVEIRSGGGELANLKYKTTKNTKYKLVNYKNYNCIFYFLMASQLKTTKLQKQQNIFKLYL